MKKEISMRKKFMFTGRRIIFLLVLFITSIANAQTEKPLTIGVSYNQIMEYLDSVISMSKSSDVNGLPSYTGQTEDDLAMLEILGEKSDVIKAAILIAIPNDDKKVLIKNSAMILRFLKNIIPQWEGAADWVTSALKRTNSTGEPEEIVKGNKLVRLSFLKVFGMISLSVKHKDANGYISQFDEQEKLIWPPKYSDPSAENSLYSIREIIVLKNGKRIETQGAWIDDGYVKYFLNARIHSGFPVSEVEKIIENGINTSNKIDNSLENKKKESDSKKKYVTSQKENNNKKLVEMNDTPPYAVSIDKLFEVYGKKKVFRFLISYSKTVSIRQEFAKFKLKSYPTEKEILNINSGTVLMDLNRINMPEEEFIKKANYTLAKTRRNEIQQEINLKKVNKELALEVQRRESLHNLKQKNTQHINLERQSVSDAKCERMKIDLAFASSIYNSLDASIKKQPHIIKSFMGVVREKEMACGY